MQVLVVLYLTTLIGWTSVEGTADKISPRPDGLNNMTNQHYDGIYEKTSTYLQSRSSENYRLPYTGEIRFPMYSGKEIVIEGFVPGNAKDFTVRLCQSDWCDSCLPFEMRVNLQDKKLLSSSIVNGLKKQFNEYTGLPLKQGYTFKLVIKITDSEFQIVIDDNVFATYTNQITFDAFKYVQIINPDRHVKIERRPGGEKSVIYGYPTNDAKEIRINVECLPDCQEGGDTNIATHVNPRFNHSIHFRKVVINHFNKGVWVNERVYDEFDFRLRYPFTMQFLTKTGSTLIMIDKYFTNTLYHGMDCYNSLDFYMDVKVEKLLMS